MPELFSRMDKPGWLTPSIADILDQGNPPPGGDGSIRERMLTIQSELSDLETPARIVNVRSTPSYTLYVARPETIGGSDNRHTVTVEELERSLEQIAEKHSDWTLGFLPRLQEDRNSVGIFLRTEEHRLISLRRLLVRSTFRKHQSTLAFVLGITLEQQLVVRNLLELGHLIIIGSDPVKQDLISGTLLTFVMLNTPAELRVALAGGHGDSYQSLATTPHTLGRILSAPEHGQRLIEGLLKEIQRRKQAFLDSDVEDITAYNDYLREEDRQELPRIILLIDSLSHPDWSVAKSRWKDGITQLLSEGLQFGIHLILVADQVKDITSRKILDQIQASHILLHSAAESVEDNLPDFHSSLLQFVNAFLSEKNGRTIENTPIELCTVSDVEIGRVAQYWRETAQKRHHEAQLADASQHSGVTGILNAPPRTAMNPPTPPVPAKPSSEALVRATNALKPVKPQNGHPPQHKELVQEAIAEAAPELPEQKEVITEEIPRIATQEIRTEEVIQTTAETIVAQQQAVTETEKVISTEIAITNSSRRMNMDILQQATALAAYLGWLGIGALHDIFGLPTDEAATIISTLKQQNILENTDSPTPRFIGITQQYRSE